MTLKEEAEQLAKDRPTSLSDDLYQWAMDAEEMLWKLSAQAAQPAPRRLTEAEITLLVEAYYEDFGSAPPDLIRQVESLIFGDAQAAQVPIYQYQLANGNWIDQTKESHDYNVRHGQATVRILYAAPSTKEGT